MLSSLWGQDGTGLRMRRGAVLSAVTNRLQVGGEFWIIFEGLWNLCWGWGLGCLWVSRTLKHWVLQRRSLGGGREIIFIAQVNGVDFGWNKFGFESKLCIYKLCDFSGWFNCLGLSLFTCTLRLTADLSHTVLIMKWNDIYSVLMIVSAHKKKIIYPSSNYGALMHPEYYS